MAAPPKVLLFALCDGVVVDPESWKTSLIGVFDALYASQFPATHAAFTVYVRLTAMFGTYDFAVLVVGPDLQTVVARLDFPERLRIDDSLQVVETVLPASGVEYPGPGRYVVRLTYNGLTAEEFTLRLRER